MIKSIQIPVDGDWNNVNDLVQSKLAADGKASINPWGQTLEILNDNVDPLPADCRLELTSDPTPTGGVPFARLLPEVSKEFESTGGAKGRNNQSLLDKWIRLLDSDGAGLVGTAIIILDVV